MESTLIDALRGNFSSAEAQNDHFMRCWSHQTCGRCLVISDCSWCPFVSRSSDWSSSQLVVPSSNMPFFRKQTWSCVPNSHRTPFLAPFYDDKICPAKQERWELRTKPLGCDCSTATTVSVIVSVVGTLLVIAFAFLTMLVALRIKRRAAENGGWMSTGGDSFWRSGSSSVVSGRPEREQEPLLRQRVGESSRSRRSPDDS